MEEEAVEVTAPMEIFIYLVKLTSGESVIGKSPDNNEMMNNSGQLRLYDVVRIRTHTVTNERGETVDALVISPWLEATDLGQPCYIPTEVIMAVCEVKTSFVEKYRKFVFSYKIQERMAEVKAAHERAEGLNALERMAAGEDPDALPSIEGFMPEETDEEDELESYELPAVERPTLH